MKIGPTFGQELNAAGLGPPIYWREDGVFGRELLTSAQQATLDRVIANHDPDKMPVPPIISRRQFYQAAAHKGMISYDEALNAMRHGAIPAMMQQGIDTLPPDQKFAAEMMLSGAGEFDRYHPLVEKFGEIMGFSGSVLDDIWRAAATL